MYFDKGAYITINRDLVGSTIERLRKPKFAPFLVEKAEDTAIEVVKKRLVPQKHKVNKSRYTFGQ